MFLKGYQFSRSIAALLSKEGTFWRFNPPTVPLVKSVKHHLRRVVGETRLTFEEFSTLLTQVEACLKSRPLLPLSDDPTDL